MRSFYLAVLLSCPFLVTAQSGADSFELLNSSYDELNPVLSPDGRTLYVSVANHPSNIGGKKDPGDIWYATLNENNQWSSPVHGGALLNDRSFNGIAGFSSDGHKMFLLNHYDPSGAPARTQGVSVSTFENGSWSKPQNISIPYFQNKAESLCAYISSDQSALVFSAETYGTRGVEDLYVSLQGADGKWSESRNLGSVINTPFQELAPSLSADGRTLYFATNGRKGFGSFDIYKSTRLDDSWTNWSEPVNLGNTVNTTGRDLYYRDYEQFGFSLFTSTTNSDGYGDIKMYRKNDPPVTPPVDTTKAVVVIAPVPVKAEVKDNEIKVYGKVVDAKTNETIDARILFNSPSVNLTEKASSKDGYSVIMSSVTDYTVKIEARGYVSTLEKLNIKTYEMQALEMNFRLQPIELGTTVNLKSVLFEQGKTNLLSQSYDELDLVVNFLRENPTVRIELAGHTDNRGVPGQNVKLSQARVNKVKDYLTGKGIEKKRITGKGYGGSSPIASNENEETRQLNRRVEFIIRKL